MPPGAERDPVTVVVIDDHRVFSRGLELLLNNEGSDRVVVVATTAEAAEAAELVADYQPDLALIDLEMPPPGGLAAIGAVKGQHPSVPIIALTGSEDEASGLAALRAGADGYVVKSAEPEHLIPPILAVAAGMAVLPGWLRDRLVTEVGEPPPDLSHLSEDERMILAMICDGRETGEIAEEIAVSERTAKRLTAGLLRHLGVANRVQAAVVATRAGLDRLPAPPRPRARPPGTRGPENGLMSGCQ